MMTTATIENIENEAASESDSNEEEQRAELETYIPHYLKQFIYPYHDEFCYTRIFHYRLVSALMVEGFLPIAIEGVILPKLHHERCVVSLPEKLHVSKSIRKKSKRYRLTVNQCFERVVEGCRRQHGPRCWLYPELVRVFEEIFNSGQVNSFVFGSSTTRQQEAPVRLYSIEIFNEESGELAAGELGYTVGSIYTSLTGFSAENSAGSVQLASLGRLLSTLRFSMWDLGMDMEYKQSLGSHLMTRNDFLAHVHHVRAKDGHTVLPTSNNNSCAIFNSKGYNCKSLIDQELPLVSFSTLDGETKVNFLPVPVVSSKNNRKGRNSPRQAKKSQHPKRQKAKDTG